MNVYEEMWKELKARIGLAGQYSLRQEVLLQDVANLIVAYENHFAEKIKEEQDKEIKEETGLDPL